MSLDIIGLLEKDLVLTSNITWLDIEWWRLWKENKDKKMEQIEKRTVEVVEEEQ
jgi:hypothetical protein